MGIIWQFSFLSFFLSDQKTIKKITVDNDNPIIMKFIKNLLKKGRRKKKPTDEKEEEEEEEEDSGEQEE